MSDSVRIADFEIQEMFSYQLISVQHLSVYMEEFRL